jgi:hypothetical protein
MVRFKDMVPHKICLVQGKGSALQRLPATKFTGNVCGQDRRLVFDDDLALGVNFDAGLLLDPQ